VPEKHRMLVEAWFKPECSAFYETADVKAN
jgi:hypothetical protein